MSVTVDQEPLAADVLGFETVGQVLAHVQRDDRMVINLLIDGQQPDLTQMSGVRQSPLRGRIVFIETATPIEMAIDVLEEAESQLVAAEYFKADAAELLQHNRLPEAMEKLGVFFSTWQSAQESVEKTSKLLKLNLESMDVDGRPIAEILADFSDKLRQTTQFLIDQDFVSLTDQLLYETSDTCQRWIAVLNAIRAAALK